MITHYTPAMQQESFVLLAELTSSISGTYRYTFCSSFPNNHFDTRIV